MLKLLDVLGFVAAFVLLLSAIRMLRRCNRAEVSTDSMLAFAIGAVAILSIGRALGPTSLSPEHVLALAVGAAWVIRSLTKKRRREDAQCSKKALGDRS